MVFLVIAVTVLAAGLTGGLAARVLGLRRPSDTGWVILGANELARAMAHALGRAGEPVLCLDTNPEASLAAEKEGLRVIHGNGLEERTLLRAEIDTRAGALGMTPNEEVNVIFAQKAKHEGKLSRVYVAIAGPNDGTAAKMAGEIGGRILFGRPLEHELWATRLRHKDAAVMRYKLTEESEDDEVQLFKPEPDDAFLALSVEHKGKITPISDALRLREKDIVTLIVSDKHTAAVDLALRGGGWEPVPGEPEPEPDEAAEAATA
jgi:Trk K+ transport system NAD-binding subunit